MFIYKVLHYKNATCILIIIDRVLLIGIRRRRRGEELGQTENLLLDLELVEEDHLRVDGVLHQVLHRPHGQHLQAVVHRADALQNLLQAQQAVRRGRGRLSHQILGQEDEIFAALRPHKPNVLEERREGEENGDADPGENGKALDDEMIARLQAADRVHEGVGQPQLVLGVALQAQQVAGGALRPGQKQHLGLLHNVLIDLGVDLRGVDLGGVELGDLAENPVVLQFTLRHGISSILHRWQLNK